MIADQESRLTTPGSSLRARRLTVTNLLRASGAGQISDSFLIPATEGRPWPGASYAVQHSVSWRGHTEMFWLRTANVPFDLLPLRPRAVERRGAFFSLGPGLAIDGSVHPYVLQVQIEGPLETVEALLERVEPVFVALAAERRQATEDDQEHGWRKVCLAGVVARSDVPDGEQPDGEGVRPVETVTSE